MHMFPGIVIICVIGYGVLRLYYRDINNLHEKDPEIAGAYWCLKYGSHSVILKLEKKKSQTLDMQTTEI